MQKATVIIPNWNGMKYLKDCLDSLRNQTCQQFSVLMVDNGSGDDSVAFVKREYPEVELVCFSENTGFCRAVNEGIRRAKTRYVILLNNDTVCDAAFVEELLKSIERRKCFSCAAAMVQLYQKELMDDAGDYYSALGWAFAAGKGKPVTKYRKERRIFASCGGAAIYDRRLMEKTGFFDEAHFAYLEDVDLGYRSQICGYQNYFAPKAIVYHAGSGTSGSAYNAFKVGYASRNSVYLIYKNMPLFQILINFPFLLTGFLVKTLFFTGKGFGRTYIRGLAQGICMCRPESRVRFQWKHLGNYCRIQWQLWINMIRRFVEF